MAVLLELYPLGGVLVGDTAPSSFVWIQFNPSGGIRVGGSAVIVAPISAVASAAGVGGALARGPTGGVLVGGGAVISLPLNFTHVPTGGVLVGGVAPLQAITPYTPTGGARVGGASVVSAKFPLHVPSGGIRIGGAAIAYFLPNGTLSTTENPYGDDFPGWAMNYETGAPSRYQGLPANSLCRFNGKTYVANAGGIYEVTGTTDAGQPIRAGVTIPKTDFDDSHNKRIPAVYVGARCAGTLLLKVMVNGRSGRYYGVTAGDAFMRGTRVTLGKGLEARYWQFGLQNMAGADFEVGDIEIKPKILARHGV